MSQLPRLPDTRSDPELLQRFLNGDRSARDRVIAHWAPTVLAWSGTGNLETLRGEYRLQRAPGGQTLVIYEAFVDLGFWIPGPLVSWATLRLLPGILTGLESQNRLMVVALN